MSWSPKDPRSSELFALDFTLLLPSGDTISSVSGITVDDPAGITIGTPAVNGALVVFRVTGGTAESTYEIRGEVVTAQGNVLDLTQALLIRTQR